ncbi:MAG TPA: tetratricopeptide repeat protein [Lacunisphaera sp.]|nr:tetratricopeptide repeat protein [Lacunisphaera sp.]
MRCFVHVSLLVASLGLGLTATYAASKTAAPPEPPDEPPQLLSTQGDAPKWKTTKQLKAFAAQGDPQACFELGMRLLDGDEEIPSDPAQARALLETAAKAGVGDALFRLGKIYHDGRGVTRDYAKALEYYLAAARRGVPEAQHNIGAMLVSARGVKRDYVEGLAWLLVAEKSGAASTAPQQVRDRLAKRPTDISAAEARARELLADLPHAVVRGVTAPATVAAPAAPTFSPPPVPKPTIPTTLAPPRIDPIPPPKLAPPSPPTLPPPAPR